MKLSPLTQAEASIGFTIGIIVGVLASWTMILFFTNWEWYFKVFSSIGEISILGVLIMQLANLFQSRRGVIEAQKMMEATDEK